MTITLFISYSLFKKVQKDIDLQDINSIVIEIKRLNKLIINSKDQKVILGLKHKIALLEKEKLFYEN